MTSPHLDDPHEMQKAAYRQQALAMATGFTKKLGSQPNGEQTVAMAHAFYLFLSEGQPSYDETLVALRAEVKRLKIVNEQSALDHRKAVGENGNLRGTSEKLAQENRLLGDKISEAAKNMGHKDQVIAELQAQVGQLQEKLSEAEFEIKEIHC